MSEMPPALRQRIAEARAFIIDMDGTIVLGDPASGTYRELPGAISFLSGLRARGIPFRIFTNGTAKSAAAYAASLREAGFDIADTEMMTPSTTATHWFLKRGIRKVRVLGSGAVALPMRQAGIEVIEPDEPAGGIEAVFTGWFPGFALPALEAACNDIWHGAVLTSASNVPFFATGAGRAIGISCAMNSMIRSLTSRRALVLGKPSSAAFHVALTQMGLPRSAAGRVVVLGDDPALEIRMARNTGAVALGMTTGIMRADTVRSLAGKYRPDFLFDDLASLFRIMS